MTASSSTEVPASAAGTIFQLERALLHLAEAAIDCSVGIELNDDVSVEGGELTVYEQDKLSFQKGGSAVSDRSHNLWNTLSIWCGKHHSSPFERGKHELWLVTNTLGRTELAKKLNEARSEDQASEAIAFLKSKATSEDENVQRLMNQVLAFPDETLIEVVIAFRLLTLTPVNHVTLSG